MDLLKTGTTFRGQQLYVEPTGDRHADRRLLCLLHDCVRSTGGELAVDSRTGEDGRKLQLLAKIDGLLAIFWQTPAKNELDSELLQLLEAMVEMIHELGDPG